MKLALTIALSHEAELLIMDEPTSGLDPLVRNEMLEILQSLILDENKSVFFSTHITSDLEKVADYITLIYNGEIKLSKTKDELLEEYCLVKGNKEMVQKEGFKELFVSVKSHEFGFEALSARKREVKELLGDSVVIEKPTLEDIMIYTTRGEYNVPSY